MNKTYLWIGAVLTFTIAIVLIYVGLIIFGGVSLWPACTQVDCGDVVTFNLPGLLLPRDFIVSVNGLSYDSCLDGYFKGPNIVQKRFNVDTASRNPSWRLIIYPKGLDNTKGDITSINFDARRNGELMKSIYLIIEKRPDCSKPETSVLLKKSIPIKYTKIKPNKGLFCGPTCRVSRITISDFLEK